MLDKKYRIIQTLLDCAIADRQAAKASHARLPSGRRPAAAKAQAARQPPPHAYDSSHLAPRDNPNIVGPEEGSAGQEASRTHVFSLHRVSSPWATAL